MPFAPPQTAPPALWAKLEALDLDGGAALSFSKRLARDNGWTASFAQRVVLEYKRFVYLAATCGHPVTPSDEVDQAWHLHLVYTCSYWDELCGQMLGFPLHHGPTKGGAAEGHKFEDWYARTLQSYATAFGTLPPADIWPPAAVRFGEAPYFQRVNLRRHWLLPRLRWPSWPGRREAFALAAVLVLAGCTARLPLNPFNWHGTEFLGLFWGLCVVLLPLAVWWRNRQAGPVEMYAGPPLSTYEAARLAAHGQRVADAALAALVHTGKAELVPEFRIKRTAAHPPTEPYERAVWNLIITSGWSDLNKIRVMAVGPNIGALQALDASLQAKGLLLSVGERRRLNRIPLLTAVGLGLFGVAKVLVGVSRDRPVGFLLASLLALCFFFSYYRSARGCWSTGRGTHLLRDLADRVKQERQEGAYSTRKIALSVALFGAGELQYLGMSTMAAYLAPPPHNSSSDGGSGCGGSGCGGGGCGGCGGCSS